MAAGLVWAGACRRGADPVREGDQFYRAGAFAEAVGSYRLAVASSGSASLWARLGAAALRAGDAATALEAYEQLGRLDPTRRAEAARGVERASRLLAGSEDSLGLGTRALTVLHGVAPDRPISRVVWEAGPLAPAGPGWDLLPAAVAGAGIGDGVTGTLLRGATALAAADRCDGAIPAYRTALRRLADSASRAATHRDIAACALRLGQAALGAGRPAEAEGWFNEASRGAGDAATEAAARLGWGEARLRQGDLLAAAIVWQGVASRTDLPDSVVRMVRERLQALAGAPLEPGQRDTVR